MLTKFVNHRTLANVLMFAFIGMGLYAIPRLQKETFPRFESSEVQVAMTYRGASAEDVEQGICLPIEDAIDGVQNVKKVTCTAQEGSAAVVVEIEEGVDVGTAMRDIETEVEAITDFPAGAEDLIVSELNRADSVLTIAITGPIDEDSLKDYCEGFKQQLKRLPGVSLVEIQGFSDRQLRLGTGCRSTTSAGFVGRNGCRRGAESESRRAGRDDRIPRGGSAVAIGRAKAKSARY